MNLSDIFYGPEILFITIQSCTFSCPTGLQFDSVIVFVAVTIAYHMTRHMTFRVCWRHTITSRQLVPLPACLVRLLMDAW